MIQILLAAALAVAAPAKGVATGAAAPDFSLKDSNGKTHTLAGFKGKTVVLEWLNYECPFMKKHYETKNMQALQKELTDKGVVWLSVLSSAPGKQGHYPPAEINERNKSAGGAPTALLIDADSKVARLYDAKTTPHMFVIDGTGKVVYQGAIDDNSSADKETVKGAKNYVREAAQALEKKDMAAVPASTKAYGCGIKFAG
jgi:peroxiredoxin